MPDFSDGKKTGIFNQTFHILVYVDASDDCNKLVFQLGEAAMGTTVTRSWSIQVSKPSIVSNVNFFLEGAKAITIPNVSSAFRFE